MMKKTNRRPAYSVLWRFVAFIVSSGAEMAMSVGLVVVCFLIFVGLLAFVFPEGSGLGTLVGGSALVDFADGGAL